MSGFRRFVVWLSVLGVIWACALSGCGGGDEPTPPAEPNQSAPAE